MIVQQCQITAAVPIGILDLSANISNRLALPRHLDWCHHPARMAGNALIGRAFVQRNVPVGVTGHTGEITAREGLVRMDIVGLRWAIAHGVTVEAAGMREDFGRFGKYGARPFGRIGD